MERITIVVPATILVLLLQLQPSLQEPFYTSGLTTSEFKGLSKLAELNKTAGETRIVYYHEQVFGIVDIRYERKLIRCELIEAYKPNEAEEIRSNLSSISLKTHKISFIDMLKLMDKCDQLDQHSAQSTVMSTISVEKSMGGNPWLIGIVPGTKWCGTGDIAKNYHDLGMNSNIDRCCRAHDLCPVKIRAYETLYNLTNTSFFSKSHCKCEEIFYSCLKRANHLSANIIGKVYFNLAQPPCIEDVPTNHTKKFVSVKKVF